jgi:anthranilate synthase/aminodeoxychorismate synthase-like glutamine amidotransferase
MILVIDNYDSFTYNLVQYLEELKEKVVVFRNDKISLDAIKRLRPDKLLISPGPGEPKDAGISCDCIKEFYSKIPILGVCLGHQAIGFAFGGKIIKAKRLMHGKTSLIYHNKKDIFKSLQNPFEATRYHSLLVDRAVFPRELQIIAQTKEKEIMALRHRVYPVFGVQFHPESILTKSGLKLLSNFLRI